MFAPPDDEVITVRAELLAFLRGLVRTQSFGGSQSIGTEGLFNFTARLARGRVALGADGKHTRDLIVLQVVLLALHVGLPNVRKCGAPDCDHLFVKRYRREYCSVACQKREYMRVNRSRWAAKARRRTSAPGAPAQPTSATRIPASLSDGARAALPPGARIVANMPDTPAVPPTRTPRDTKGTR